MFRKIHQPNLKSRTDEMLRRISRRPEFNPESLRKISGKLKTGLLTSFTPDKIQPATQNN